MCGRFTLRSPGRELQEHFDLDEIPAVEARYNVAPTQQVLIVVAAPRRARPAHWGLIPPWAQDASIGARMINARAESLRAKPAFRDAFAHRRCLIPADGFYEWRRVGRQRVPMHIRRRDGRVFAFAGLWARWRDPQGATLTSCTIVTTTPNELVGPIHDRMPVVVAPPDYPGWLGETGDVDPSLLLQSFPSAGWEALEVGRSVNDARVDSPECIRPAGSDLGPLFAVPR